MVRLSALALLGAMTFTTAAQVHQPVDRAPVATYAATETAMEETGPAGPDMETLEVIYTPLKSTEIAKTVGFGIAYHMAIVFTDRAGRSYGVSAVPSDLKTPQTPRNMFDAILYMAGDRPSTFGTLVAETNNNTAFVRNGAGDYYTQDKQGHRYPHALVARGRELSAKWSAIVATYARISRLGLTYSPMTQNSNTMAAAALRRAGLVLDFSSKTYFTPGAFTQLPS